MGIDDYYLNIHGNMWQIIRVDKDDGYVNLKGMVKFKCGEVILSTLDQKEAMDLLMKYIPSELKGKVNYQVIFSGDESVVVCGDWSRINCGNDSNVISEITQQLPVEIIQKLILKVIQ